MTKRELYQPLLFPPSQQVWTRAPLNIQNGSDSYVVEYVRKPTSRSSSSKSQAQRYAELTSSKIANDVIDSNRYGWQLTEEESDAKVRADLIATNEAASMRSNVMFSNCFDNPDDKRDSAESDLSANTTTDTNQRQSAATDQ